MILIYIDNNKLLLSHYSVIMVFMANTVSLDQFGMCEIGLNSHTNTNTSKKNNNNGNSNSNDNK